MGFNTWDFWGCSVNASVLMRTAQAMHDTGLKAAGYQFVNSDDCALHRHACVHATARAYAYTHHALTASPRRLDARKQDGRWAADPLS
jgi:hypothetical protein